MSATTSTVHTTKLPEREEASREWVKTSTAKSHQQAAVDPYEMSPRATKIVYLTLAGGVVFLVALAAYVWHGYFLWQQLP